MMRRPYTGMATRQIDPTAVDQFHAIADSTAAKAAEWVEPDPATAMGAGYAQGVADVLAWLNGAEPSTALTELLDG